MASATTTAPTNNKTLTLPKLHTGQLEIVKTQARFNVLACGRRFGKTTLGLDRIVQTLLKGLPCAWMSPYNKMMDEAWREALALLRPIISRENVQSRRIELVNGASIDFWSLDNPDGPRGRKYARIVIDEAALVKNLEMAWFAVIRPTLTDYQGDAFILSTPRGLNFFYKMYLKGLDPLELDWVSFTAPTTANPFIKLSEVEEQQKSTPVRIFQQEYEAAFDTDSGGVFRNIEQCIFEKLANYFSDQQTAAAAELSSRMARIVGDPVLVEIAESANTKFKPHPYKVPYSGRFIIGLDWAMQVDFTVATVIDVDTHQVVEIDRFNQIGWEYQYNRVDALFRKWGAMLIISEHNSIGGPNETQLMKRGLPIEPFVTNGSTKPPLIENLVLGLEQQDVWLPNDPVLLGELRSYERKTNVVTGRNQYSASQGSHDDTVMSLALAYHGVTGYRTPLFDFV